MGSFFKLPESKKFHVPGYKESKAKEIIENRKRHKIKFKRTYQSSTGGTSLILLIVLLIIVILLIKILPKL